VTGIKTIMYLFSLAVLLAGISGCAAMNMDKIAEGVEFRKVGEFTDRNGQAKILLVVYSGKAGEGNIRQYAEKLGCQMIFAYYYPDSTDRNEIPAQQLESARNFAEAREVLFQGEGVGKWRFASQCLGMIPKVTDCLEYSISTNCR
jgi:hypothetical protein